MMTTAVTKTTTTATVVTVVGGGGWDTATAAGIDTDNNQLKEAIDNGRGWPRGAVAVVDSMTGGAHGFHATSL